jgi:DNA-directed RNA polymerase specialized sigma24 family protein
MRHLDSVAEEQLASREPDPADAVERVQLIDRVRGAFAELRKQVPECEYEAFALHWLEGLSVREVALRLGRTEKQVWASHHRVSRKLRPLLGQGLGSGPRFGADRQAEGSSGGSGIRPNPRCPQAGPE